MMPEDAPTSWELMRSINALRESVDKLAAGVVTQATLAVIQRAQLDKDDRQDARISELEQARDDERKTKAQQWFAIGLSLLGMVGTVIGGVIVFNLNGGA